MPGLINQGTSAAEMDFLEPRRIAQAQSFSYDPTLGTVNLATDSVSGQLDTILSQDSPYITRARSSAAGVANSRGLLNSTMGAQAGEAAAIDAALPIAQQDANTFSTQRLTNQAAGNTASQFGAAAANQTGIINANAANQIVGQQLVGEQSLGQIAATGTQQRLTGAQQAEAALGQISATGTQQRLTGVQQSEAESRLLAQKGEIDRQLQTADAASRQTLLAQQGTLDRELQTLRGTQAGALSAQEAAQNTALQTALQGMRGDQAQELAEIEASYKTLMQTNDSAGRLFQQGIDAINKILTDNNMDQENKQAAINIIQNNIRNGLHIAGTIANMPGLPELLDFDALDTDPGSTTNNALTTMTTERDRLQAEVDRLSRLTGQGPNP